MNKKLSQLFSLLLAVIVLLSACADKPNSNAIDDMVLSAWEGSFSIENRRNAIHTYAKKFIPVYAGNLEGDFVSFTIDFDATECGHAILAPVNDTAKDAELNTIVDFVGDVSVRDKVVTVDVSWWYDSEAPVKNHQQWSYLFWVSDASDVRHYYYFRVDYSR